MGYQFGSVCYADAQAYAAAWVLANPAVRVVEAPHPDGLPGTFTYACRWVANTVAEDGASLTFSQQCENSDAGLVYFPVSFVEYMPDCGDFDFSAKNVTTAASWGFGVVIFLWFLGYCIGAGLKAIRSA